MGSTQPHRQGKPLPLRDSHRLMLAAMATSSVPGNRQWVALANTELGSLASSGLAGLQRESSETKKVCLKGSVATLHACTHRGPSCGCCQLLMLFWLSLLGIKVSL